jgi:methionyl-tRNA formyltransferase
MLIEEGYDVAAIVVHDSGTQSRKARELEVETLANSRGIPVLRPHKLSDIAEQLRALNPPIAVLVAFGKIVPKSIIDIFPYGILNIHPSALPQHRGSIPIESVMLDGSTETAVSLMKLAPEMDAGPVFSYTPVSLTGSESKQELADLLNETGAEILREILPKILADTCQAAPQNDADATYDERIEKADGIIDASKPAVQLEREVRAYQEWPKSTLRIADIDTVIMRAHVASTPVEYKDNRTIFVFNNELCLRTSDGVLVIDSLKPAGKKEMTSQAFLNGYGKNL